ncbi:hypothetical protein [Kitasatospora acidiphila]|uniref:hypothetical protein n=1 Tax=Kitasatospora acidiphila TaxID=2567942 RepID=UPI003C779924
MTATNDAPDRLTTAEDRWQQIEHRLAAIERRIHGHGSAAIATIDACLARIDACLARLDALRHDLAHGPWPPQGFPTPAGPPATPPQPARARTESPPATAGHRHAPTVPDAPLAAQAPA